MAKKILTTEEIRKKQYSALYDLNQKLKLISNCYYIGKDGTIYLESLVPFVEKVVYLKDVSSIDLFRQCMILPNQFFQFGKNAKKSKLIITPSEKKIFLGQDGDDSLSLEVHIAHDQTENDKLFIETGIIPKFYKRFFELEKEEYIKYENQRFISFTDDEIDDLCDKKPVYKYINDSMVPLTIHVLLDLKNDDDLQIQKYCYLNIDGKNRRTVYMIKHENDIYTDYTIFNTLE